MDHDTGRVAVGWDETGRIVERPAPAEPVTVDIQRHVEILAEERALTRARVAEEIARRIEALPESMASWELRAHAARFARENGAPDA